MALSVLNMSDDEIDAIFRILSGILMTGNVEFKASSDGESCSILNPEGIICLFVYLLCFPPLFDSRDGKEHPG